MGTLLVLIFGLIIYLIFKIKISPEKIQSFFENTKKEIKKDLGSTAVNNTSTYNLEEYAVAEAQDDEKTEGIQYFDAFNYLVLKA